MEQLDKIASVAARVFLAHMDETGKNAGAEPGKPDGSGSAGMGRGLGPGKGTKSGLGLILAKQSRGEKLTEEEEKVLKDNS